MIQIADANSLDLINHYTLSGWYFTNNTSQVNQTILGKGVNSTGTGYQLLINADLSPKRLHFGYNDGNGLNGGAATPATSSTLAGWHLLTGTYDGKIAKLYLDGMLKDSVNIEFNLQNSDQPLLFGNETINLNRYFNGKLDDIGIWNRALTEKEIKELYQNVSISCSIDSLLNPALKYDSIVDIDGNTYPTITINGRKWMAQNLRTTRYANGDPIPNLSDNLEWISATSGAWCYYANDSSYNCNYGKLYNWFAITDKRNICPSGWRVLTGEDWGELVAGVSNQKDWLNASKGWEDTVIYKNLSGMSLIPGGLRGNHAGFFELNNIAWFGLPNKNPNGSALSLSKWYENITGTNGFGYWNYFTSVTGTSVRCVQNKSSECNIVEQISPGIIHAPIGSEVKINALFNDPGAIVQWQVASSNNDWMEASSYNPFKFKNTDSSELIVKNINTADNLLKIRMIARKEACADTSNTSVIIVQDTCTITRFDTIFVSVMDTLLINFLISSIPSPSSTSLIKLYPNPTSSQLVIDFQQYPNLSGYSFAITNSNGAMLWKEKITQDLFSIDLSKLGSKGLYFFTIIDPQGKIATTRKIVLQ
jgi:uncharacterized protein (TIGR02145 family)